MLFRLSKNRLRHSHASVHTGVGIRFLFGKSPDFGAFFSIYTDCHTSDIGHWFAMTDFFDKLKSTEAGAYVLFQFVIDVFHS